MRWARSAKIAALALCGFVEVAAHPVSAQPPKVPRIGVLASGSPATHKTGLDAFRQGLRGLGFVEGLTITIEYRWVTLPPGLLARARLID